MGRATCALENYKAAFGRLFHYMNPDFQSSTWHQLRKWAEDQLKRAREKNDALALSPEETAALRGEIRALKRFLDLPNAAARGVVVGPDV